MLPNSRRQLLDILASRDYILAPEAGVFGNFHLVQLPALVSMRLVFSVRYIRLHASRYGRE